MLLVAADSWIIQSFIINLFFSFDGFDGSDSVDSFVGYPPFPPLLVQDTPFREDKLTG